MNAVSRFAVATVAIAVSALSHAHGLSLVVALAAGHSQKAAPQRLSKLEIVDKKVGQGNPVKAGDRVYIKYRGTLADGTMFDTNEDEEGVPFTFVLKSDPPTTIKGMDQGVLGMKVGGQRLLKIPAALGYGDQELEKIPRNSDLYFDVELLYVVRKGEENVYDWKDLKVGKGRAVKHGDTIVVNYKGWLVNDKLIDTTYAKGREPVQFKVGSGRVLRGVDAGVVGMRVGGKRKLWIPPNLAYGAGATMFIPSNSVLIYEIELMSIK